MSILDLESLKIFEVVVSELSITRAASRLGRAPSNVTTRIQQLEAELGAELFVRTGKRIALSGAGQQLLGYAQRIRALEDEARHVVSGGAHGGTLRIGSMESTAASRLPSVLAAYNQANPTTRLEVSTGPTEPLLAQLRNGQLDCAFVALPEALRDEPDPGLQSQAIWQEELCLLLPAHDAEATAPRQVRTRTLAGFKVGCSYRALAENALGITAGSAWRVQELGSYHGMIAAVSAGACVAVLPRSVLALSGHLAPLASLGLGLVDTCLVWRSGYDVPAFEALRQQLEVPHR